MFAGLEHALSLSKPARPCSVLVVYPGCRPVESIQSCTGSWPAAGTVTNFDQEQRQEGRPAVDGPCSCRSRSLGTGSSD